jgi:Domain of unknown function (DUF4942)/Uncharacterised methyltransferase family (DUF6094)
MGQERKLGSMSENEIALLRRLPDVVAEYDAKVANIQNAIAAFEKAGTDLKTAATVGGTWGRVDIKTGSVYESTIKDSLCSSAWLHIYSGLQIDRIATAADKKRFERGMADPAPFTLENIRATYGKYILDPRGNILRGLAEVFCDLDPAYKSHERVKIGVDGLPKRIIMTGFGEWSGWGRDKTKDILNALASCQGKAFVEYGDVYKFVDLAAKLGNATLEGRGVSLRVFKNGNGHLFFEPDTLRDINLALAEYYGEVLADCYDDGEEPEKRQSTAVSKDLQYYPTPKAVVERVIDNLYHLEGTKILEPSCGCGRFMDALRSKGAHVFGIEVDAGRAEECRAKGHKVLTANFLETVPTSDYDRVVMNPPFYRRHYAQHVKHALKFLKPDGVLTAILPITARYDHGALDDVLPKGRWGEPWSDLPVGSFRESGTNINTTVLTIRVPS